jgi:hypothetical protein
MSRSRLIPAGLALVALPLAVGLATKTFADPVIAGNSYTETITKACNSAVRTCEVRFSSTPTNGSLVRFQNLSCTWTSPTPLRRVILSSVRGFRVIGQRFIGASEIDQPSRTLNVPLYNTGVGMTFPQGIEPELSFVLKADDRIEFTCTIAGLVL